MEVIRYVILFLILLESTSIGFVLSKRFSYRVKELQSFLSASNVIENKIKFTKEPLSEIFEYISEITNDSISAFFKDAGENIKKVDTKTAWEEAINKNKEKFELKKEDIVIIKDFGTRIGKTDVEGQLSEIALFNSFLKEQIIKAKDEQKRDEKMYKSLGGVIGLGIIILLV